MRGKVENRMIDAFVKRTVSYVPVASPKATQNLILEFQFVACTAPYVWSTKRSWVVCHTVQYSLANLASYANPSRLALFTSSARLDAGG